jgi:DNA-binding transcriptional ArsR family regulator
MGEGEGKGKNKNLNLDLNKGEGKGEGPKRHPPPSPSDLSTDIHKILDKLLESFRIEFGRVPAENPDTIIPREPTPRERAQIRDLAAELVRGGGCPLSDIREAFREAAGQEKKSKRSVSYVAGILRGWLGRERNRSP